MLLEVKNLSVSFPEFTLHPVSFTLDRGEILALVGESGSGKTTLARAVACLSDPMARVSGQVYLDGRELLGMGERERRPLRMKEFALSFQREQSAPAVHDALCEVNPPGKRMAPDTQIESLRRMDRQFHDSLQKKWSVSFPDTITPFPQNAIGKACSPERSVRKRVDESGKKLRFRKSGIILFQKCRIG